MASTEIKHDPLGGGENQEGTNVNKIRDILFGSQMRDYEQRFARVEERLAKATDNLREEMKKQVNSLESFTRQELESLSQRLKTEKGDRAHSLEEIAREFRENLKALETRLADGEEQVATTQSDIRSRVLEQAKTFSAELEKLQGEIASSLDQEVRTLRSEKIDRDALADLFSEFALRLRDQLSLPKE